MWACEEVWFRSNGKPLKFMQFYSKRFLLAENQEKLVFDDNLTALVKCDNDERIRSKKFFLRSKICSSVM